MPPLVEIKGLGDTIRSVTNRINAAKDAARKLDENGAGLVAELTDIDLQLTQHREDLRFQASTLGNSPPASEQSGTQEKKEENPPQ